MPNTAEQAAFDRLLEHLRHSRGFDFASYKRASLMRRVLKRMHALDVRTFEAARGIGRSPFLRPAEEEKPFSAVSASRR